MAMPQVTVGVSLCVCVPAQRSRRVLAVPKEGVMARDAHEQHETLDHLVDDYSRTGMSRRQFLQRAMAAGLTAASASALLAACASSSTSKSNSGKVVEVLFGLNTGGLAAQQRQWFDQITSDFHALTGATLRWDTFNGTSDELTRIQTAIVSGGGPDVFTVGTTFVPTAQATGGFDLLSDADWQAVGGKSRFFQEQLTTAGATPDKPISVPFVMRPFALVYNTDLFQKANITSPPTSWSGFVSTAQKLTDASAGIFGTAMDPQDTFDPWKILWHVTKQLGGDFISADYKTATMNSPEVVEAMQFWFDWVTQYKIVDPNSMSWKASNATQAFGNGKVGMQIMVTATAIPTLDKSSVAGKYAFAPLPTIPYGMQQLPANGVAVETIVSGDNMTIASYSTVKDLALKFIGLVTDTQHQLKYTSIFGDLPTNADAANQLAGKSAQTKAFVQAETGATAVPTTGEWGPIEVALAGVTAKLGGEVASNTYSPSHIKPLLDQANATIQAQLK
jgi:multiple sugar transport system substrate-binding protein